METPKANASDQMGISRKSPLYWNQQEPHDNGMCFGFHAIAYLMNVQRHRDLSRFYRRIVADLKRLQIC